MAASKRTGLIGKLILFSIVGGGVTIWAVFAALGALATREWNAYTASLRAKGQPITYLEIEALRAVIPDERNSARVIERLANQLKALESDVRPEVMILGSKIGGDSFFDGLYRGRVEASRKFVNQQADLLEKLGTLQQMERGHFAVDYNREAMEIMLPDLSRLRNASKVVALRHRLNLIDGNVDAAVQDTRLMAQLSRTLHQEPTLISRLVQIAIESLGVPTVENLLRVASPQDEQLASLSNSLKDLKQEGTLRWALLGERAFFVQTLDSLITGKVSPARVMQGVASGAEGVFYEFPGLPAFILRSNQLHGVQMYTSMIEAVDDPKGLLAEARRIEGEIPKLPRTHVLVKILMPSLSRAVIHNIRNSAQLECATAGLAAERFRLATDRMPETLEELVPAFLPAVPTDPFDGKPLRMAKTAEGIVIYSVDENSIDDGGSVAKKDKEKRPLDIGFRLNDPSHRGLMILDDPPADED